MDRSSLARQFADHLECLARGEMTVEALTAHYEDCQDDPVSSVWPWLEHYLCDDDIRAKDEAYAAMQNGELAKLIGLLQANAPDEELTRISFLSDSDMPRPKLLRWLGL